MNNKKPLVTVIIPAYNHESYVKEAILSVINQSYGFENIQLIVADDCSRDNTVSIIRELANEYNFRFIEHSKNLGISSTLNEVISISNGEYITSFASDDIMLLDRIENQIKILKENPDIDILAGNSILIDEKGKVISETLHKQDDSLTSYNFDDFFLLKWPGFTAGAIIIKRELYNRIGAYDPSIKVEDYYYWLKASYNGAKIAKCNLPLLYYRVHPKSVSSNESLIDYEVSKILALYKDHPNYSKALQNRAIYNLSKWIFISKINVIKHIIKNLDLLLNVRIIKILIMLVLPTFVLNMKFPENYTRNATL